MWKVPLEPPTCKWTADSGYHCHPPSADQPAIQQPVSTTTCPRQLAAPSGSSSGFQQTRGGAPWSTSQADVVFEGRVVQRG